VWYSEASTAKKATPPAATANLISHIMAVRRIQFWSPAFSPQDDLDSDHQFGKI